MRLVLASSAKVLILLCPIWLLLAAAQADTPHFLSDQFALPLTQAAAPIKKPLYGSPNNRLERIPPCSLYFGFRMAGPQRVIVYRYAPAPKAVPNPKNRDRSQRRK